MSSVFLEKSQLIPLFYAMFSVFWRLLTSKQCRGLPTTLFFHTAYICTLRTIKKVGKIKKKKLSLKPVQKIGAGQQSRVLFNEMATMRKPRQMTAFVGCKSTKYLFPYFVVSEKIWGFIGSHLELFPSNSTNGTNYSVNI